MDLRELESYRLGDAVKFNDDLNPQLWGSDEHLLPEVREKLLAIADDFREFLGIDDLKIKDITVSGSNASYTYTPHSDIDLHLVVDIPDDAVYRELFDAKKYQYNDQHNFTIGDYDVELYVQDADQPHYSQGIYSLMNNDWVSVPRRRKPQVNDISVKSKYEDLGHRIEAAIQSQDLEQMDAIAQKVKHLRSAGLEQTGEFGPENLAFKILRNNGTLDQLRQARMTAKDQVMSLEERKKKKKKKKTFRYGAFGGYYYPGYHYYGDTGAASDGGGDGGGGESVKESVESRDIKDVVKLFAGFAAKYLELKKTPKIKLRRDPEWSRRNGTFGQYMPEDDTLILSVADRHPVDVMRTLAHEFVHHRQNEIETMPAHAGETGSEWEDEANAIAGRIMRDFAEAHPGYFDADQVEEGWREKAAGVAAAACIAGTPGCATMGTDAGRVARDIQTVGRAAQSIKQMGVHGARDEIIQRTRDELRRGTGKTGVNEASGYIPTAAEKNDPRYSMALTVDIKPGQVGKEANKLRLKTDSQGRPQTAKANGLFENLYREYKRYKADEDYSPDEPPGPEFPPTMPAGTVKVDVSDVYDWYKLGQHISNLKGLGKHDFGAGPPSTIISFGDEETEHKYIQDLEKTGLTTTDIDPKDPNQPRGMKRQKTDPTYNVDETIQAPINKSQDAEQYYKFIVGKARLGRPLTRAEQDYVKMYQMYRKQKLAEDSEEQDLMEVKMSPGALEAWARSPEAEGIRAGFEAEMIFRDTRRDEDEDYDQEPDYDYDERPDDIDHVIDFFSNDDYGYGLSLRGARNLRESLWEAYTEWVDEKISESWDENAEDQVRDYMETNVWNDDSERESRIRDVLIDLDVDDIEAVMAAGEAAPRFTRSSDHDEYARSNELYQKFKQASDAALEAFEEEIVNEFESQGEYYDAAREYYVDMTREGGEFDERDFLRDRYGYMTDIANEESLDWPYWSGGSSGTGSRDWSDIGDSLQRAIDMPVRVSSGYHSTTRRPGLWIIEPDGSLDPDDRDDEMGLEIVSPPLPLPETLEKLKQVLEWGNSEANAYTNSSTGLHMGISIPYVGGDVDYVKLVLFMGDEYVLDKFGRASNTYAASAMEKLRNSMQVARRRGTLTEARFDPLGALELVQKNLIELAARYVQNGVGTSKYTSAHIQDGYIEFRSPGGDYLSMADRGEEEDIRNTMLRFARAMQIAGSPSLERREYAKKLYKLISPGAQDDGLKLFSQFAAGTITPEELKKQWANAVLQKEIPTTGQEEWEVYDQRKSGPDGVIDSFYADEYDTAYMKAQDKYGNTPEWRNLDIRKKQPWYDVKDSYGDIILTVRARDFDSAKQKVQAEYGDRLSDDWTVYRRPDDTPEPEKKLSPRAQVAKRLKEPKVTPTVAADNERDREQIQARIGEPQPAGAVGDTGHYRVMWDERRNGTTTSDSLNIDAASAEAARQNVLDALQMQGRDVIQISAHPQQPPAWRRNREPVATSTQGEFSGQWQVRNANTGEVVYTFSGIGNNQGDANRVAQQWVQRTRFDDPVEVVPELR
jgi:hypothetical protein